MIWNILAFEDAFAYNVMTFVVPSRECGVPPSHFHEAGHTVSVVPLRHGAPRGPFVGDEYADGVEYVGALQLRRGGDEQRGGLRDGEEPDVGGGDWRP